MSVKFSRDVSAPRVLAWMAGELRWKLMRHQLEVYDAITASTALTYVVNCSRRFGKTFIGCLIASECALKRPGSQIRFAAPTAKSLRLFVHPNMRELFRDAPAAIRPVWRTLDGLYQFRNGSQIYMAGTDAEHRENLRGTAAQLVIVEEAGSCDELAYTVNDILMPQTLTTGGRVVLISTPPKTPAHDYTGFARTAEARGNYIKRTIHDNTSITSAVREKYAEEVGGKDSTTWRREYLCEFVTDEESAVIPEFTDAKALELVREPEVPRYFLPLVAADIGFEDFTAILFGYYDFAAAKLVIQDERFLRRMTTADIASAVRECESALWGAKKVYSRVSDTDLILINDLSSLHKLAFSPTLKDEKEAQINELRMWVKQGRVIISPRCANLIRHLKTAVWNKQRTGYERTRLEGHFDGVDALVYMLRNAPVAINPYPEVPEEFTGDPNMYVNPARFRRETGGEALGRLVRR